LLLSIQDGVIDIVSWSPFDCTDYVFRSARIRVLCHVLRVADDCAFVACSCITFVLTTCSAGNTLSPDLMPSVGSSKLVLRISLCDLASPVSRA
jgi:hypothetical protein